MKINNKNVEICNINQKKLILPKYSIYLSRSPSLDNYPKNKSQEVQHEVKQQALDPSRGSTVCG